MTDKQITIDACPYQGECSISGCRRNDDDCFVRQLFEERDRAREREEELKQTLTEIEEIAKNMNTSCFYDDFDCKDCDMKNGCIFLGRLKILQKIKACEVHND